MWLYALKYWKVGALVALLLVIAGLYAHNAKLSGELDSSRAELTVANNNLALQRANVESLKIQVANQNAAIEKLEQDTKIRASKAAAELAKANSIASGFKTMADNLLNTPPDPKLSMCENANVVINKEINRARTK
jgi:multidrug resistance efflux pump